MKRRELIKLLEKTDGISNEMEETMICILTANRQNPSLDIQTSMKDWHEVSSKSWDSNSLNFSHNQYQV